MRNSAMAGPRISIPKRVGPHPSFPGRKPFSKIAIIKPMADGFERPTPGFFFSRKALPLFKMREETEKEILEKVRE